ncbi:hypothetical protein FDECE_8643 [Fusarium decemcellulare]|nr:hypothetical protein FDECE_8643 [Fusarium decemcellulare]
MASRGGAEEMTTVRDNVEAFDRYKLRPRILRDVDGVDVSSTIFGTDGPLGFAPAAAHKLAHPDGELATSRAAATNNIPMALSSWSSESLEDVAAQGSGNPYIMQVTFFKDLSVTQMIIKRAEGDFLLAHLVYYELTACLLVAGYKAIFVSVDLPVLGRRLNEARNDFTFPRHVQFPNLNFPKSEGGRTPTLEEVDYDPTIIWDRNIAWLRAQTKMEIWLKGVYTAEDVEMAIHHKLDGVIISNHGGRQLDGVPATLDALRECAAAGRGRIPIAFDGGTRRGSDIFKAIALGADFCFVGRIPVWGLAYNGEAGVDFAVKLLLQGLKQTMMFCGCRKISDIKKSHLSILTPDGVLSKL